MNMCSLRVMVERSLGLEKVSVHNSSDVEVSGEVEEDDDEEEEEEEEEEEDEEDDEDEDKDEGGITQPS